MRIAVIGGSAAGMLTGLLAARAGHEVVLLERDDIGVADDVEAAADAAFRSTAPHIVQPHAVLALCRQLVEKALPDVYADLFAAGVLEAPLSSQMPPTLPDRSPQPGDDEMSMLITRRSTFDWVLRRTVQAQAGIDVREGVRVTGLVAEPGTVPRVTGVRVGDETVHADLVVDASGRRTPISEWLADICARPLVERRAECGLAYYSQHYRLTTTEGLPGPLTSRVLAALPEFTIGVWAEDNGWMVLVLAPLATDRRFKAVRDPAVFRSVVRATPPFSAWLDVLEPVTPIYPMAGLDNAFRELAPDSVDGLVLVGDSTCTTNPTLGRGLALALREALDLVAWLDDPAHEWTSPLSVYEHQAAIDGARLAMLRHAIAGGPPLERTPDPHRTNFGELRAAAPYDPAVFRASWKVLNMLAEPEDVYTDPDIVARTRGVLAATGGATPPGPTHDELEAALAV